MSTKKNSHGFHIFGILKHLGIWRLALMAQSLHAPEFKEQLRFFEDTKTNKRPSSKHQIGRVSVGYHIAFSKVFQRFLVCLRPKKQSRRIPHLSHKKQLTWPTGDLVGGFNPFEKYESKWVHLPQFSGWKYRIFELPPPRDVSCHPELLLSPSTRKAQRAWRCKNPAAKSPGRSNLSNKPRSSIMG